MTKSKSNPKSRPRPRPKLQPKPGFKFQPEAKLQPLRELPASPKPLPAVEENTILRGPENVANDERNVREAAWLFVVVAVLVFGVWAMGTPTFYDWPWLVE